MTKARWIMTERFLCACECKNVCELATMGRNKIPLRIKCSSYVTYIFFKCTQGPSNISLSWHTIIIHGSYQGKMLMKKQRHSHLIMQYIHVLCKESFQNEGKSTFNVNHLHSTIIGCQIRSCMLMRVPRYWVCCFLRAEAFQLVTCQL